MESRRLWKSSPSSDLRRPDSPDDTIRIPAIRIGAVIGLIVAAILAAAELTELRGELAFVRFLSFSKTANELQDSEALSRVVQETMVEADLIMTFSRRNPDALQEVTKNFLRWSLVKELDPSLRLRLAEMAVQAAMLAVCAAPSDFEPWHGLAQAHYALGLQKQANICLKRAQELAPPGMKLKIP